MELKVDLSIIVPVYNVEKYLKRCINSLFVKGNITYEVLLVDDGSTDNSAAICDQIGAERENFKVFHKENEGLGYTRNFGIDHAVGDYILFVDSDDYIKSDSICELIKYMREKQLDVAWFGRSKDIRGRIEEGKEIFPRQIPDYKILTGMCLGEPLQKDTFEIGPAWKGIYRKEFLQEHSLLFESERICLSEDYLFSAYLCLNNPRVGFWNYNIYFYCENDNSLSKSYNPTRAHKAIVLFDRMEKLINEKDLGGDSILRAYSNFIIVILLTFKHIVFNDDFCFKKKMQEIQKICNNEEIIRINKTYQLPVTRKLKLLQNLMLKRAYIIIYILIFIRYR